MRLSKNSVLAVLTFLSVLSFNYDALCQDTTQVDSYFIQVDNYFQYERGCDTGGQQWTNICLIEAEKKLSGLIDKKYNCIISYLDSRIALKSNNKEALEELKQEKESVVESQKTWGKLSKENQSYYKNGGGTMTPMLLAESLINDDKDRLRKLDDIIEDLAQGRNGLRCN